MIKRITCLLLLLFTLPLFAQPTQAELSVWVNEAIVSVYTYDYQNYLEQQRVTAHYFTPHAWIAYSEALTASHVLDTVQKNKYFVSAVATNTPQVTLKAQGIWEAKMPVLVVYRNAQYEQRQPLEVNVMFKTAPGGKRGLVIESFQSVVIKPACHCDL